MKPDAYVPDYIIYDELKRKREGARTEERPQLEMPRYTPYWPESMEEVPERAQDRRDEDRGETVIRMW